jgi:transcriptional regulator with XRE-family HTH domain
MAGKPRSPEFNAMLTGIGKRLFAVRQQTGKSPSEMASFLGFSRRQWDSWEKGQVTASIWTLLRLKEDLDIDPEWLLIGPGDIPVNLSSRQPLDRHPRLCAEVAEMAKSLDLDVSDAFIQNLVSMMFTEPELEDMEKDRTLNMLQALAVPA